MVLSCSALYKLYSDEFPIVSIFGFFEMEHEIRYVRSNF